MNQIHSPESICILSLGPIGDAVLTTPLLYALRDQFPTATVTVVAGPRNREVFESCVAVDEVLVIRSNLAGIIDAVRLIVGRRWDIYIDPKDHESSTSKLLSSLFRYQTGFVHPKNLPAFRSTILLPPADGPHFVDSVLTPLTALGLALPERRRPRLTGQDRGETTPYRPGNRVVRILLNISAGDRKRMWRESAWHQLLELLVLRGGFDIAILSAPVDLELASDIATGTGARLLDTPRLPDVFDAIAGVDLVVTPDTSVVHIASAFNVPTVALFTSDDRNMIRFAPLVEHARTLQSGIGDGGIGTIEVETVVNAIDELLSEVGPE
jgi:ADP-heptose:LPS heptosyltransferase